MYLQRLRESNRSRIILNPSHLLSPARRVQSCPTVMLPSDARCCPIRAGASRAFTLVELMIVVAIIGVLAALGLVGFRKYLNASHSSEAVNTIGAIKAAQESYRAETLSYLNVSSALDKFYPVQDPTDKKVGWGGTGNDEANWKRLNVNVDGATLYSFATIAGLPGQAVTTGGIKVSQVPTFPAPVEPWYLIQAKGNVDGDSIYMYGLASSFSSGVYVENDDE